MQEFYRKTKCCWSSRLLVKLLMGPMALRDMALSRPHSRLGPNTTARLLLVILFTSLLADTWRRKSHDWLGNPWRRSSAEGIPRLYLRQEGDEVPQRRVVLFWQRLHDGLHGCHLVVGRYGCERATDSRRRLEEGPQTQSTQWGQRGVILGQSETPTLIFTG